MTGRKTGPNEAQQKAIDTVNGPVLIIAGPGSGKTYTLVERVYHLLVDKHVAPENIFISTFTEKAARELVTRISNRIYEANLKVISAGAEIFDSVLEMCS